MGTLMLLKTKVTQSMQPSSTPATHAETLAEAVPETVQQPKPYPRPEPLQHVPSIAPPTSPFHHSIQAAL